MSKDGPSESEKPMSNALYQDNRIAPIIKVDRIVKAPSPRKVAAGTYQPRGFEDLRWRVKYRMMRAAFTVFGPPQLRADNDPLALLARRREERYANWSRKGE